jgi:hypothetical protein
MKAFVVKAKQSTYAGSGKRETLDDGAIELVYQEGVYRYRDRYFGDDRFSGQEVVHREGKPVWTMNYYGHNLQDIKISTFLKEALRLVPQEAPFRGPTKHQNGEWRYTNEWKGDIDCFQGYEAIYYQGKQVYELWYHGGTTMLNP